jgi:methylthioribose-1-phosphate isomerase
MESDTMTPKTVDISVDGTYVEIIDQTRLPGELVTLRLKSAEEVRDAIAELKVRGAPAIGVAAAYGVWLGVRGYGGSEDGDSDVAGEGVRGDSVDETSGIAGRNKAPGGGDMMGENVDAGDGDGLLRRFREIADMLAAARPTAVNLQWALDRMERKLTRMIGEIVRPPFSEIKSALLTEARAIAAEDAALCEAIGQNGLALLKPGMSVLTYCNAGRLATAGSGTALAPVYAAHEKNYGVKVYCCETRPLLQGARLTSWELTNAGIDTTLICDNMAASLMAAGAVDAIFVGCDRMARNGDAANKIGTLGLAVLANRYHVPFYVCLPHSTIDADCADGSKIVIEERPAEEVTERWFERRIAPDGVKVWNPAFDVTPAELITAIVTDKGVFPAPYKPQDLTRT